MIFFRQIPPHLPADVIHAERARRYRRVPGRFAVDKARVGDCRVVRLKIAPRNASAGKKLLFFADLHFNGAETDFRRLAAIRDFIRHEKISGIVIGGDAVGDAVFLPEFSPALRILSREVDFAVASPGNWEQGKTWIPAAQWRKIYRDGGFDYLVNEGKRYGGIFIAGVADIHRSVPQNVEVPPDAAAALLLAHCLDDVIYLDENGALHAYQTALCGHYHGGQICLPLCGALFIPGLYGRRFGQGVFRRDGAAPEIFVTRGAGELSFPYRLGCSREIAVIEIG